MRVRTVMTLVASTLLVGCALVGCAGGFSSTAAPTSTPTLAPAPGPSIAPGVEVLPTASPQYHPGGTAQQNEQYWDAAIAEYWRQFGLGSTQTMIDLLLSWGFDPAAMEITYDSTVLGLGVDSIEVAVRFADTCLLAVVRVDRWATTTLPVLGTGRCLVGETRPIG